MKLRIHVCLGTVLPLISSLSVFFVVLYLTRSSVSILIAFALGICAFSLHETLNTSKETFWRLPFPTLAHFGVVGLYCASLIITMFSTGSNVIFASWSSINIQSFLQFIAAVLLTHFFPGYVILQLILGKSKISMTTIVVFSYLTSTFSMAIFGFSLSWLCVPLPMFGKPIILLFNVILLAIYVISRFNKEQCSLSTKIDVSYNQIVLMSIIAFFAVATFSVYFSVPSSPRSDAFEHLGSANKILKGLFPWDLEGSGFYPFLFHFYFASFFSISSLTLVNSYILLVPFIVMVPLAFTPCLNHLVNFRKKFQLWEPHSLVLAQA